MTCEYCKSKIHIRTAYSVFANEDEQDYLCLCLDCFHRCSDPLLFDKVVYRKGKAPNCILCGMFAEWKFNSPIRMIRYCRDGRGEEVNRMCFECYERHVPNKKERKRVAIESGKYNRF